MLDSKFLASAMHNHLASIGYTNRLIKQPNENGIDMFGKVRLTFFTGEKEPIVIDDQVVNATPLEVMILGEDKPEFGTHVASILNDEFWKSNFPPAIRQKRNATKQFIQDAKIELNGSGDYIFSAKIVTQNEGAAQRAIYNHLVRPLLQYCISH